MSSPVAFLLAVAGSLLLSIFGPSGNYFLTLLFYGATFFLFDTSHRAGWWYIGTLALLSDLIATSRFGIHILLAALVLLLQIFFVEHLRFTAHSNRRAIALLLLIGSCLPLVAHVFSLRICLLSIGALLILLASNYLLVERSTHAPYANS